MVSSLKSAPNIEMLTIADAVSREKHITREEVLEAMAQAVARAGKQKYGPEYDIRATIDPKTGEMELSRYREVVEELEDEEHANIAINLKDAKNFCAIAARIRVSKIQFCFISRRLGAKILQILIKFSSVHCNLPLFLLSTL